MSLSEESLRNKNHLAENDVNDCVTPDQTMGGWSQPSQHANQQATAPIPSMTFPAANGGNCDCNTTQNDIRTI